MKMVTDKKTDKLVFDLEILQVDYSEQKKNELKKKISEKYNVPLKNVEVNFKNARTLNTPTLRVFYCMIFLN